MSDPLDVVFIDDKERLARYLAKMPQSLQAVFAENFQRIDRAELAQLRVRAAMLEVLEGEDGLAAINRLMSACEQGDIPQQLAPDITEARAAIVALLESFASLKARNDELEQREIGYNAEIERLNLAIDSLRTKAAECDAAHVYLDESYINDPDDAPIELADRIARLVNELQAALTRIAELEADWLRVSQELQKYQRKAALRQ